MKKHIVLIFLLVFCASHLAGCSKSPPLPLNAGECKQMKDKQLALMLAEVKKEYGSGFEGAEMETILDCNSLKEKGRVQYECTMSAKTMADLDRCLMEQA